MDKMLQFLPIPTSMTRSRSLSAGLENDKWGAISKVGSSISLKDKGSSNESIPMVKEITHRRKFSDFFEKPRHLFLSPRWQHKRRSAPHLRKFSLTSTGSPAHSNASSGNNSDHNSDCGDDPVLVFAATGLTEMVIGATDPKEISFQKIDGSHFDEHPLIGSPPIKMSESICPNVVMSESENVERTTMVSFDIFEEDNSDDQKISDNVFEQSSAPLQRKLSPMSSSLHRSMSLPVKKGVTTTPGPSYPLQSLPRVTVSDFSSVEGIAAGNPGDVVGDADSDTPYVTLDDVAMYKADFIYDRKNSISQHENVKKSSCKRRASLHGYNIYSASKHSGDMTSSTTTLDSSMRLRSSSFRMRRPSMSVGNMSSFLFSDDVRSYTNSSIGTGDTEDDFASLLGDEPSDLTSQLSQSENNSGTSTPKNQCQGADGSSSHHQLLQKLQKQQILQQMQQQQQHQQQQQQQQHQQQDTQVKKKPSGWRKLRSMVQWTPFIQTYKNRRYQWVQLAGHSGNFKAGKDPGTVLKKLCPQEEHCYKLFSKDTISPFVPKYQGTLVLDDDEKFLQLQDCLSSFTLPSIMDCKIGVRTYLEEELAKAKEKPKLRKDMYEKMVAVDPSAPTEEEHRLKGITKPRYMVWRETISSTAMLGFRIEGVKKSDGTSTKDFKTTKTKEQVLDSFRNFIAGSAETARQYLDRLKMIRQALERSEFFKSHELIGSSLLFVHDSAKACVWLIDFGKTVRLPEGTIIDHKSPWEVGNHEDGYLIGIQNLITIFSELVLILERESDEKDGTFNRKIAQPSPSHS